MNRPEFCSLETKIGQLDRIIQKKRKSSKMCFSLIEVKTIQKLKSGRATGRLANRNGHLISCRLTGVRRMFSKLKSLFRFSFRATDTWPINVKFPQDILAAQHGYQVEMRFSWGRAPSADQHQQTQESDCACAKQNVELRFETALPRWR